MFSCRIMRMSETEISRVALDETFLLLSSEMKELYPSVEVLDEPPDPLTFYRKYVSQNRPVLIKNVFNHWPALNNWSEKYFREKIGQTQVTVAVTPNGYADAISDGKFVMPEERRMEMSQFLDILFNTDQTNKPSGVFYIQKQNSNLHDEFAELMKDVDSHIDWGSQAFGAKPDAVNFWMGDRNAVTSMHRDHYENLYCVLSGEKIFTLLAPTDLPFIPYESCSSAVYRETTEGHFEIVDIEDCHEDHKVQWIAIDPLRPDLKKYPQYAQARPLTVSVKAGETLYLPSLWFHHVQQSHGCIAVNYWYDMDFDIKWAYYKFLEKLSSAS
ncbi:bifunctional peptidase and (3S)-lysyl hydroxylase Jmjd7-like [Biomphalaria glabrata]|uniref:Bifunctional peptidase and (3S)-lysyl hydroxylase JMJD7 n=1 Tax=Biomphalaria glabrata TaxID=6526 RepID=A0A9U8E712_BIOGL|nr:bifunctional peptidase and (3S)-lysyl hydroxylase Jmjd7-like [Biomphalaria glabrata]